ncbi:MAG: TlpA disulfide reductase family protein [Chloroflexota bacterium]
MSWGFLCWRSSSSPGWLLGRASDRPVLINFWASWCPPCRLEMPDLVRAYEAHKAEGFVILAIDLTFQDSLSDVEAFVKEFNMTFPVLLDGTGEVTSSVYRLPGLPMSIFVDREGFIRRMHIGAMTGEQIDQFVGEILK